MNPRCAALVAILLVSAVSLHAAETPIPAPPTQWVTDTAHFMSPGAASSLNATLQNYERSTGHQLIVYIGETTGDAPIEDWAVRAFEKWRVGRKGIDDGLALFIMSADRKLRFEVGYGLEPQVTDAIASRVINEVMVPRIRAGDPDGAVTAGMDAVMMVIGGAGLPFPERPRGRGQRPMTLGQLVFFGIIGLLVLSFLATHPTLAIYLLATIFSGGGGRRNRDGWGGGGGGDWGGGGGGFSGGGGSSGGGGASGSW